GFGELFLADFTRIDIDGNVDTGGACVDHRGVYLDYGTDGYGFVEADSTDIDRYTIALGPSRSTGIGRLIDPFHHLPTVNFSAEIDVRGFTDKLKCEVLFHVLSFC